MSKRFEKASENELFELVVKDQLEFLNKIKFNLDIEGLKLQYLEMLKFQVSEISNDEFAAVSSLQYTYQAKIEIVEEAEKNYKKARKKYRDSFPDGRGDEDPFRFDSERTVEHLEADVAKANEAVIKAKENLKETEEHFKAAFSHIVSAKSIGEVKNEKEEENNQNLKETEEHSKAAFFPIASPKSIGEVKSEKKEEHNKNLKISKEKIPKNQDIIDAIGLIKYLTLVRKKKYKSGDSSRASIKTLEKLLLTEEILNILGYISNKKDFSENMIEKLRTSIDKLNSKTRENVLFFSFFKENEGGQTRNELDYFIRVDEAIEKIEAILNISSKTLSLN